MNIAIDLTKCIECGWCAKICPGHVITLIDKKPQEEHPEGCISCGHCVAICPQEVIHHNNMDMNNFPERKDHQITQEQIYNLIRGRRSTRHFKPQPISEEEIKKLMEKIRYSPTGSNDQELNYIIITNPNVIAQIRNKIMKIMQSIRIFHHSFKKHVEKWKEGEDPALRTAPSLLVIYAKKKNSLTQWDAAIATTHIMLGAETMGLGTCWGGYHAIFSGIFPKLKNLSGVPRGYKVVGSLMLGYPAMKFKRFVDRNPVNYKIIN